MAAAAPGDVITFAVPGVVLTTGQIVINKNLTIRGGTNAGWTQISRTGPTVFRLFDITAGTVTIDLVTLGQGAAGSGGAIRNNGTLTLTRSNLTANSATGEGGALFNRLGATLTVTNTHVSDNTVTGTTATRGGAISNEGTLTVSNSRIQYNNMTGGPFAGGGGIANRVGGTLRVVDTHLEFNRPPAPVRRQRWRDPPRVVHRSLGDNSILFDNTVTGSPSRGGGWRQPGPRPWTAWR